MLGAVAAAQNDSITTAPAAVLNRGLPSWLGETAKSEQQLFFLAMPSTASSTLDHALQNMARAFAEARAGEDGDALAAIARGRCRRSSRNGTPTRRRRRTSACAGRDARALARHLDLGYRGRCTCNGPSLVRTFAENALRKAAERRPRGARLRQPLPGEALLVRSASRRVRRDHASRARAWARSVARRFWGADPSGEALRRVRRGRWLWNAHARMLSGNFTRFSSEVLVANASADPDGRPWKAPHATAPSRAQALPRGAPPAGLLGAASRVLYEASFVGITERVADTQALAAFSFCWDADGGRRFARTPVKGARLAERPRRRRGAAAVCRGTRSISHCTTARRSFLTGASRRCVL